MNRIRFSAYPFFRLVPFVFQQFGRLCCVSDSLRSVLTTINTRSILANPVFGLDCVKAHQQYRIDVFVSPCCLGVRHILLLFILTTKQIMNYEAMNNFYFFLLFFFFFWLFALTFICESWLQLFTRQNSNRVLFAMARWKISNIRSWIHVSSICLQMAFLYLLSCCFYLFSVILFIFCCFSYHLFLLLLFCFLFVFFFFTYLYDEGRHRVRSTCTCPLSRFAVGDAVVFPRLRNMSWEKGLSGLVRWQKKKNRLL